MKIKLALIIVFVIFFGCNNVESALKKSAEEKFKNEILEYDISFLWFNNLAVGSIAFLPMQEPETYQLVMQAKTRGLAARFTRNRIERFETVVDVLSDGSLRPLIHSSHRITGTGDSKSERTVRYTFDYNIGNITYERIRNGLIVNKIDFCFDPENPVYDILSALYNFRLGYFGTPDANPISIPTFHHRIGEEVIEIELLKNIGSKDMRFFDNDSIFFRVLIDPSIFNTKSSDVFISFDSEMRLQKGIIKKLIGLGDLRGELRSE